MWLFQKDYSEGCKGDFREVNDSVHLILRKRFAFLLPMTAKVQINGHIGESYVEPNGQLRKGTVLLDVIEQVESVPDATQIEVYINSPGGFADIGDSIYDYLVSQKKKGKVVTTIQTGLVGSIATKIFLAGDRRIADDRYEFFIHNPYIEGASGDQDQLREMASGLQKTEQELRKLYAEFTTITDEGLDGLMKIETGLTADQCVKFGFATEKKLVPVFNSIHKPKMSKEKSFLDHVSKFFEPKGKGVSPKAKAEIPASEVKTLVVTLAENAGSFWVEGEAVAVGSPAYLLDADGQPTQEPLADGAYVLEDGTTVMVAAGMVTEVTPAAEDKKDPLALTEEAINQKIVDAVNAALAAKDAEQKAAIEQVKQEASAQIQALKKNLKLGVQPVKGYTGAGQGIERKSINQIMAEKREERKKQLLKN